MTCFGLLLALASCAFAFGGDLPLAMTLFVLAGLCDLFDGAVARKIKRTDEEKAYGVQLDSLADCVSFGAAPVVLAFAAGYRSPWSLFFYAVYAVHAVVRLAYFNTVAAENPKHYLGLPVTYIALLLPIALLFRSEIATCALFAVTGELFVIKLKVPKPAGVWYGLFPLIAAGLIAAWWLL